MFPHNERGCPISGPFLARCGNELLLDRKFSGATGTLAPASFIPTSGQKRARYGAPAFVVGKGEASAGSPEGARSSRLGPLCCCVHPLSRQTRAYRLGGFHCGSEMAFHFVLECSG